MINLASLTNSGTSGVPAYLRAAALAVGTDTSAPGTAGATSAFGDAVNLTLSPQAEAVAAGQNPAPASGPGTNTAGAAPAEHHTPRVPITNVSSNDTTDTLLLYEEAMQQLIPEIGVTDASEVVSSNGTIDEVKLQQYILQQDQPPSPAST